MVFVLGIAGFPFVALVLFAPIYVSAFAVGTQRLRDIDLSGWWILMNFVPLVGTVFALYVIIKRGTHGANRFGPDPLGPGRMDEHW